MCALMRMNKIRNVLILCPVSVLANWQSEVVKHLIPYTQVILVK